ncbi:protein of unknown function DUF2800 [Vibrio phage 1.083.O._10N.286.52.B9]|nr:protein of unknown function DUF2800 [Vibrio phage 1.083.O._10N.286.52.B9]
MEHSVYGSASAMSRTAECAGHIRMTKLFHSMYPELVAKTNPAAEEGTAAHDLGEFCLRLGVDTYDCIGMEFNNHTVTDTMADYINVYVGEIRRILSENPDAVLMVEKRVVMSSVGDDVFGTGDCIIYVPSKRKMYNIDLKYGFGIVDVNDNIQLAHYGVSTFDTFQYWDLVDTVEGMIIQPRADHIDGVIRRFTFTRADLIDWQRKFVNIVALAKLPDAPLNAGEHCHYCDASPICRPRMIRTLSMVGHDKPLEYLLPDEILSLYKEKGAIMKQLEKQQILAVALAKSGKRLDGYKLVKAKAYHSCDDEDAFVSEVLNHKDCSITSDELFNRKLKGKTALKNIKGVPKSIVDKHFSAPPTSLTLVKNSDSRPAHGIGGGLNRFSSVNK